MNLKELWYCLIVTHKCTFPICFYPQPLSHMTSRFVFSACPVLACPFESREGAILLC